MDRHHDYDCFHFFPHILFAIPVPSHFLVSVLYCLFVIHYFGRVHYHRCVYSILFIQVITFCISTNLKFHQFQNPFQHQIYWIYQKWRWVLLLSFTLTFFFFLPPLVYQISISILVIIITLSCHILFTLISLFLIAVFRNWF